MSSKNILVNVILFSHIVLSIQLNLNRSYTYQNSWEIDTNLLDYDDDSTEKFDPCLVK